MTGVRKEELRQLVTLSEVMLEHARRGDWEYVPEAEQQRRQFLERYFTQPVAPGDQAFVRGCVERILELDRELLRLSKASRAEAAEKLNELRRGRRAQAAYQDL